MHAAGLSEPLPRYSLFCGQLWTPSESLLYTEISNFRNLNLVTFYLCIYLILNKDTTENDEEHFTLHLQYKPHSSNSKKMQPHDSQSSRENAILWHIPISLI